MTVPVRTSERVNTTYLKHPITFVGEHTVIVFAPDGRRLCRVASLSTARRVVRGFRKAAA